MSERHPSPITGYVDAVDLDHEFDPIGCTFAPTLEDLYYTYDDRERTCLKECGVYRVEIRVLEKIPGGQIRFLNNELLAAGDVSVNTLGDKLKIVF